MKDGPQEYTRPAETYKSCSGCSHYDRHMVRSGRDPLYVSNCKHPDLPMEKKIGGGFMRGNLPNGYKTPDWCPFLSKRGGGN